MLPYRSLVTVLAACLLAGCSVYPLPQDTTGLDTSEIVDNIRCEARSGLQDVVLETLRINYPNVPVRGRQTGASLADQLEADPSAWNKVRIEDLNPGIREAFAFYRNSQIAYLFSLTMEEQNTNGIGAGFTQQYPGASRKVGALGLSANSTRTRNVVRTFNVVDTFENLVIKVNFRYCLRPRIYDIVYPIRGKLPIKDLMMSYVRVNTFRNLAGAGDDPKKVFGTEATPAIPQMGDTVTFTTKLSTTINPTLGVTPPGLGLLLTSAGFKTDDYRSDMHKVVVVASTSPDAAKLSRYDPNGTPVLPPEYGGAITALQPLLRLPPIRNGALTDARANFARRTLNDQLQTNFLNDISAIADGFRRSQ